uniref:60S ribosomal protein L2, mitochondrial n=2 Tax=Glycine subgen. Soja TaxID=1462606 RepID=A0A0R0J7Z4_SOYBN
MSGVKRALRQFTFGTGKTAGRNSAGRITSFHRGGGAKRLQRTVDHKRNTASSLGVVERIEYDPNRSSKIALVRWIEGVHHRRRQAASANAASPKLLHLDPAATDANSIRGVFALNSMLPHAHAGTSSRELFLSALASKAKGSESESVSSLGIPRFAVAAARAPFFAQRAIGEETLEVRHWRRNSDAWAHRNKPRGLKDPSFRVIQNHFAISGNLGEVAAKEEVWEVVAQLVGLSLGILILDTPGLVKSYGVISLTWLSMRLLHLWLCYESLSVLQFNTINIKRARILVKSHVLHSTVPGCTDSNREVNILAWSQFMKPKIIFGLPLEKMDGVERSYFMVEALIKLYASEKYILMVNQQTEDLRFYVSFKVGATNVSVLRSVWQSFWLSENWDSDDNVRDQIATSLMELEEKFEDFIQKLKDAEWDTQQFNLKVPKEIFIDDNTNSL